MTASAGLGYYSGLEALEYNTIYWNLGLTWFFKYAALDIRYADSAELEYEDSENAVSLPDLKQNFIVSLSVGF